MLTHCWDWHLNWQKPTKHGKAAPKTTVGIKAKLHQCEVARAGFVSLLTSEIEAQNKVFKDEVDEEGTGDEVSGD